MKTYIMKKARVKIIGVTGTPGTGKTRLAKKIVGGFNGAYLNLGDVLKKKRCGRYNPKERCWFIDKKGMKKFLRILEEVKKEEGRKGKRLIVIDSHLVQYIPKGKLDLCIVCKCSLGKLKMRLKRRGYSGRKVMENLEAEIFDVCYYDALEEGHRVIVVNTEKKEDIKRCLREVRRFIN